MKTVEEVRRERLAQLRAEAGSLVALNTKLGLNARDATLSQILNAAKNSRTGTPKQMGSKLARELELACGKEVGWMDTDPALLERQMPQELQQLVSELEMMQERQRAHVIRGAREAMRAWNEAVQAIRLTEPDDTAGEQVKRHTQ